MSRKSVRWGIDLGTTNSAIACLSGDRVEVKEDRRGYRIIPSAVAFKPGVDPPEELVGRPARNLLEMGVPEGTVAERFKRHMGNDEYAHEFPGTGIREHAFELSARVLRAVNALAVSTAPLAASVITVPAAFDQVQKAATARAARLAGVRHAELLQEPVAAALAFAHALGVSGAHTWLAYDLGGGTFDAALIRGDDGTFSVIDHEGHGDLGGMNLDEAIIEQFVLPTLPPSLQKEVDHGQLKSETRFIVEQQKCLLARQDEVGLPIRGLEEPIRFTRCGLARLEAKLFAPTLRMCRDLLARNRLDPRDIDRMLLVGGPTLSPSLRTMLSSGWGGDGSEMPVDGLGIPLDTSVDPLLAVAIGAAHFAAGLTYEAGPDEEGATAAVSVELAGVGIESSEQSHFVAGRVVPQTGHDLAPGAGWSIRFVRLAGGEKRRALREDSAALAEGGGFSITLPLEPGENSFRVEVVDPSKLAVATAPAEIRLVRSSVRAVPRTLLRDIGVADHTGRTIWLVPKGRPLPASSDLADGSFFTTRSLEPGQAGQALAIPILEGNEEKAHLNRKLSSLEIRSEGIERPVFKGSEVEIQIMVTESEEVEVDARLPGLGIDLEAKTVSLQPTLEEVQQGYDDVLHDIGLLRQAEEDEDRIVALLAEIARERRVELIRDQLEKAVGEPLRVRAVRTELELLQRKIDPYLELLDRLLPWYKHREYCDLNMTKGAMIVEATGSVAKPWLDRFEELRQRYSAAVRERDEDTTERIAFIEMPALFMEEETLKRRVGGAGSGKGTVEARRTGHLITGDVEKESGSIPS